MNTNITALAATLFLTTAAFPGLAHAQDYPSQPIRMVIPYGPGGAVDTTLRLLAEKLQEELGQPIVIDSRPGGLGIIAMNAVAAEPADGYTFFVGNQSSNLITPLYHTDRVTVDYFTDFRPVVKINDFPAVMMVTTANFDVDNITELFDYARESPGSLRYTSTGVASFPHFDFEMLASVEGLEMTHVPVSNGAAGIAQGVMNGDAQVAINNIASSLPVIESGHAKAVAVIAPERLESLPDVPTFGELGYSEIGTIQWVAVFGRSDIPEDRLEKVVDAFNTVLSDQEIIDGFEQILVSVNPTTSLDDAQSWFAQQVTQWEEIIEVTGITR